MLQALLRRRKDDAGFTLVELMIVILIIGILIAIGLPTFLGARERAQDRVAQALLRNGLTAAKVFYTDYSSYFKTETLQFNADTAESIEPSIDFGAAGDSAIGVVGITVAAVADTQWILLQTESASGYTFCLADVASGTAGPTEGAYTPGIWYSRSTANDNAGCEEAFALDSDTWAHA